MAGTAVVVVIVAVVTEGLEFVVVDTVAGTAAGLDWGSTQDCLPVAAVEAVDSLDFVVVAAAGSIVAVAQVAGTAVVVAEQ